MKLRIKKKTLSILLGVITLCNLTVVGLVLAMRNPVVTITITADGFSPKEVVVSQYTTLVFKNDDKVSHWPASNFHPTHTLYPEFDPKKPILPQNTWSFTIEKIGVWKYHDHLFPHQRGQITVVQPSIIKKFILSFFKIQPNEKPSPIASLSSKKIVSQGLTETKDYQEISVIAKRDGPEKAWEYLKKKYEKENGATGMVHDLAHYVGSLIYRAKGFDGIGMCTNEFAFGCYHGFLDVAFQTDLKKLPDAEKACAKVGKPGTGPYASCVHGIGHGIASFYNVNDLQKSLTSCDILPSSARPYCYDGVFMEFAREANTAFYQEDNPLYPCNSLSEKYVYACGRNQPGIMMRLFGKNFQEVASICSKSSIKDLKRSCYAALGFTSVYMTQANTDNILTLCKVINDQEFTLQCLSSAAGELVFQNDPEWQTKAPILCNALTQDQKASCIAHFQRVAREYSRN